MPIPKVAGSVFQRLTLSRGLVFGCPVRQMAKLRQTPNGSGAIRGMWNRISPAIRAWCWPEEKLKAYNQQRFIRFN
jgi:hypothetical protein